MFVASGRSLTCIARSHSVNMNRNTALLRLPTEIRQEIWKYVLGGKTYLASRFGGRYYSQSYSFAPSTVEPRNGMALLRACRQIYSEAVLYAFFKAAFAYHDLTYLKRSVKALQTYQRKHITHLRIDCQGRNYVSYLEGSGRLYDIKLDFVKMCPALINVTVLVHGITDGDYDSDHQPFVAEVENLPPRLRKIVEAAGASLDLTSTQDVLTSRYVDKMDDTDK